MAVPALPALWLRGLVKTYDGTNVLDGVDLTVTEGSVFGFLGPNGAGKTTTLRILTGLADATAGTVRILGRDVSLRRVRRCRHAAAWRPGEKLDYAERAVVQFDLELLPRRACAGAP